jgi:putative redox protein
MTEIPPITTDLAWRDALRFDASCGANHLVLDSRGEAGPSPVQALAMALAGCMAMDVVHILQKGRLPIQGLRAQLIAGRSGTDPKRIVSAQLHLSVVGDVPGEKVERAIALSRETYCSVWHSLNPDITFTTSFEVVAR